MIKNYIVTAKRVLLNKFVFTLLNISGLALGIAAAALIFHYISFEQSFDNYHPNSENIYRLSYGRISSDGSDVEFASACPAIGPLLTENYPDIVRLARLAQRETTFAYEENKFIESKIYYAEQEIFNILHFNIIQGSVKEALTQHNNIVISKNVAERYFGESNPIGKRLKLNKVEDYQVVAVFEDVPDAMIINNEKYEIIRTNYSFNQIFGYSSGDVYGKSAAIIFESQADFDSCVNSRNDLLHEQQSILRLGKCDLNKKCYGEISCEESSR